MKRFYTLVSTQKSSSGFDILLDAKPVNTPFKNTLSAPTQALANEVLQEWTAQEDQIVPDTMPLTQILSTKIDRVSQEREAIASGVLKYLDTDLVCYRAPEPPEILSAQQEAWDPILEWFSSAFDGALKTTTGLSALSHDEEVHKAVREYVDRLDDHKFTLLQIVSASCGSLVLALAFIEKHINAQQVFDCAHIEERFKAELYNEEKYGADPAQEKKDKAMMIELEAAEKYLNLM